MTNTLVQYVKQGTQPVGCVIAHKHKSGRVTISWSKCLRKPTVSQRMEEITADKWNKAKALSIAINRSNSMFEEYCMKVDIAFDAHQGNFPKIPSIIRKHIRKMAVRAEAYFKDKKNKKKSKK
jgi:hypothetical protein